jgi:hypothetical protein
MSYPPGIVDFRVRESRLAMVIAGADIEEPSWTPADIPGLVLGLDNQLVTVSGGLVTAWPDLWGPGNHFTQASPSIQPTYVASDTDFPTAQPSVNFADAVGPWLAASAGVPAGIQWVGVVATYPAATFASYSNLLTNSVSTTAQVAFRGENTTADWRVAGDDIPGTRYRDGTATNTALTMAGASHLYELVSTSPYTPANSLVLGSDPSIPDRRWRGSVCLVLAATAVPDAPTRAALLAYCQGRGMIP